MPNRYPRFMLKPQDIVVLLKLIGQPHGWTFERIASELDLSPSAVHRSLERAEKSGLYDSKRKEVDRAALSEFLLHGARYVFPPIRHGESRGIPTAWGAPPLRDQLISSKANPPVWPFAKGKMRGIALEPLHPVVPEAAKEDPSLGELLALFDAIRIGNARERGLAGKELSRRLKAPVLP
jgi:DNA-binding Lrp family transcriptional regulator